MTDATPPQSRRFPAPWSVVEVAEAFVVVDAAETRLSFIYFDESERGANSIRWLKPSARRVAEAIAALPKARSGGAAPPAPFSSPLAAEDRGGWFTVTDSAQRMVCAVYVDEPKAGSLSWDEARRLANGIAKLPDLLGAA